MNILVAGLAAKDKEAIVNAIKASSPEDIAVEILELNNEKLAAAASHSETKQDLADALDLNKTHQSTVEELTTIKQDLADALDLNKIHEAAIETLSTLPKAIVETVLDKALSFVQEGVEYIFSLPAILHKGVRITPIEVMADKGLQGELIKIGSGMITAK